MERKQAGYKVNIFIFFFLFGVKRKALSLEYSTARELEEFGIRALTNYSRLLSKL